LDGQEADTEVKVSDEEALPGAPGHDESTQSDLICRNVQDRGALSMEGILSVARLDGVRRDLLGEVV